MGEERDFWEFILFMIFGILVVSLIFFALGAKSFEDQVFNNADKYISENCRPFRPEFSNYHNNGFKTTFDINLTLDGERNG